MNKIINRIKVFALMLAALIVLTSLAACSFTGDGNESSTPKSSEASKGSSSESSTEGSSATETPTETPIETPADTPTETETKEPEPPLTLNFGSYNIANGSGVGHNIAKLGEDIKNKGLDIVGLQEVDQFANRSGNIDTMKLLSESSGLPYYTFFKAIDIAGGEYGLGILSRYPILEHNLTKLKSGGEEQRILGHAVIDVNGTEINFFVTHLSYESKTIRDVQFKKLAQVLSEYDNFIITGDFNTSDFSEYSVIQNADMVNNSSYKVNTFPSSGTSIDNIVYSKDTWSFDRPKVLVNGHSDHSMLYASATLIKSEE